MRWPDLIERLCIVETWCRKGEMQIPIGGI